MLTDTHAHLDYPEFAPELDAVIQRAADAGINRIIAVATSIESCARVLSLAERFENVFAAVGFHPTNVQDAPDSILAALRPFAAHPKTVALGETGLDHFHLPSRNQQDAGAEIAHALGAKTTLDAEALMLDSAFKERQAILFTEHLELASELGLNVVVHQRDCLRETIETVRPYSGKVRAVFHCFTGTLQEAQEILALGHLVSFTGMATFKNARAILNVAVNLPLDSFMLETDCPYLAPVPYRGKRSEPAHLRQTAETIAHARSISLDALAEATEQTANGFFRFTSAR